MSLDDIDVRALVERYDRYCEDIYRHDRAGYDPKPFPYWLAQILAYDGTPIDAPLRQAHTKVIQGLLDTINTIEDDEEGFGPTTLYNLKWMMEHCIFDGHKMPLDKIARWVGFVQGVLAVKGLLSVDAERDRTRPFFHDAYREMGIPTPKSVSAHT